MEDETIKNEILDETIVLFNENGLKFTMDELASELHRSKKTIYSYFPDKEALLNAMVDYVFDSIKKKEQELAADANASTVEKLRRVLGAMPEQYQTVDFSKLYVMQEKFPKVYSHIQRRLENGWEQTIALLVQGMNEGTIRRISIPVFKTMFQATLEQFFQQDVLMENGISYGRALDDVVNIMIDGVAIRN